MKGKTLPDHVRPPATSPTAAALPGVLLLAALLAALLPSPGQAQAQDEKPGAALAPLAVIGEISAGAKGIVFNSLQSHLSRSYQLVPQAVYQKAEDEAFAALDVEQCTEENCIRKIQEILQVERLIILQMIREETLTQLTLTIVRGEERIVRDDTCPNCNILQLRAKLAGLVSAATMADLGGSAGRPGWVFVASQPTGARIVLDGRPLPQTSDALLEGVPAGEHTLSLTKGGLVAERAFRLAAGDLVRLELKLAPALAELLVNSTPFNALVTLDGEQVGKTPARLKIGGGKHLLRIEREGFVPLEREIEARAGASHTAQAALAPRDLESERAYAAAMSSHRWKFWGPLTAAILFGAAAYTEAQAVATSNETQAGLYAQAEAAVGLQEYDGLLSQLDQEREAGLGHEQSSDLGYLLAAGAGALMWWLYAPEPEEPEPPQGTFTFSVGWLPPPGGAYGGGVGLAVRW